MNTNDFSYQSGCIDCADVDDAGDARTVKRDRLSAEMKLSDAAVRLGYQYRFLEIKDLGATEAPFFFAGRVGNHGVQSCITSLSRRNPRMFDLSRPKTAGEWIANIAVWSITVFLVWWLLRAYVL